jgi:hypothetical protein
MTQLFDAHPQPPTPHGLAIRYWRAADRLGAWVHVLGIAGGFGLMALGSTLAVNAHELLSVVPIPHTLLDMVAYGLHGFGAIPVYKHGEHLWDLFTREEVEKHVEYLYAAEAAAQEEVSE